MVSSTIRRARMTLPRGPDTSHLASALDNLRAGSALSLNLLDGRAAAAYDAALLAGARHLDGHVFLHVVAPEHLGKVRGRRVLARVDLRLRGREQFGDHRPGRLHLRAAKAPAGYRTRARAIALVDVAALDHLRDERRGVPHDRLGARHDARPAFSAHLDFHRDLAPMCFTVSPPLPMTRPSLPLTLISMDALPVLGSILIGGMSNDGADEAAARFEADAAGGSVHLESLRASVARFFVRVPFRVGGLPPRLSRRRRRLRACASSSRWSPRRPSRAEVRLGRRRGLLVVVVVVVVVVVAVRGICIHRRGGIGVVVCGGVGIGGGGFGQGGVHGASRSRRGSRLSRERRGGTRAETSIVDPGTLGAAKSGWRLFISRLARRPGWTLRRRRRGSGSSRAPEASPTPRAT